MRKRIREVAPLPGRLFGRLPGAGDLDRAGVGGFACVGAGAGRRGGLGVDAAERGDDGRGRLRAEMAGFHVVFPLQGRR